MLIRTLNEHWIWKRALRVFGHLFRAPTLDRLATLWMHKLGILGHEETHILRQLLRPGMTILDVGANQGLYTLLVADLVRPGKVFAFEPQPILYQQLVSNVAVNKVDNVVCNNLAVSGSAGRLTLQPGRINWGDNRIVIGPAATPDQIEVNAVRLDDRFADQTVDFLKMDIQGWEAEALFGARRLLERNLNLIVMFELWPYGLLKAGSSAEALLTFLRDLEFQLWKTKRGRLVPFKQDDLPDRRKELSYCNLVGAKNPLVVKHIVT
jgi:FkbM family methyltransferase